MLNRIIAGISQANNKIRLLQKFNELMHILQESGISEINIFDDFFKAIVVRRNKEYIDKFTRIPFEQRIVILPQCLRNSDKCRAKEIKSYYQCNQCGNCKIKEIVAETNKLKYQGVFIIKGVRAIAAVLNETHAGSVLGVGCVYESAIGIISCEYAKIPVEYVLLSKDGCVDTEIDLTNFKQIINFQESF